MDRGPVIVVFMLILFFIAFLALAVMNNTLKTIDMRIDKEITKIQKQVDMLNAEHGKPLDTKEFFKRKHIRDPFERQHNGRE